MECLYFLFGWYFCFFIWFKSCWLPRSRRNENRMNIFYLNWFFFFLGGAILTSPPLLIRCIDQILGLCKGHIIVKDVFEFLLRPILNFDYFIVFWRYLRSLWVFKQTSKYVCLSCRLLSMYGINYSFQY